ncbi:MAG: OadG family protein [Oscillospiraceae bacterium]|nr:OadG family protein [Oscillospiraceae bacterium]
MTTQVSGTPMALGDAAVTAVMGYAIVFFGILLLVGVVVIVGAIMKRGVKAAPAKTAPEAKDAEPAPGAAGELKLHNVEPKTAAMLMAIVADKLGKPLNELRFKSIKEVEGE